MSGNTVQIREYESADYAVVRTLFTNGLIKLVYPKGFDIQPYISESLNTDLSTIESTYLEEDGSNFWVAVADDVIIGMTAIKKITADTAELRRMSVSESSRRSSVASNLLKTAENFCINHEYDILRLTTTTVQIPAINLYQKNGFEEYDRTVHGLITAVHFKKTLPTTLFTESA